MRKIYFITNFLVLLTSIHVSGLLIPVIIDKTKVPSHLLHREIDFILKEIKMITDKIRDDEIWRIRHWQAMSHSLCQFHNPSDYSSLMHSATIGYCLIMASLPNNHIKKCPNICPNESFIVNFVMLHTFIESFQNWKLIFMSQSNLLEQVTKFFDTSYFEEYWFSDHNEEFLKNRHYWFY